MNSKENTLYKVYGLDLIRCEDARELEPILSDNPAVTTLALFKELTGYPNYGNPSDNADILYTGTQGEWDFQVPATFLVPGRHLRAQLDIRAVLDDRAATPESQYSATIIINGEVVHRGRLNLEHGKPFGRRFDNWRTLTFNVPDIRRNNEIVIRNTSNGLEDDWIGLDWMEMKLFRK